MALTPEMEALNQYRVLAGFYTDSKAFVCLLVKVATFCSLLEALEDLIKRLLVSDLEKPEILKYFLRSRPYG